MFLHLEGVNLDATIYDTNDLSTIRGSSMFLETLANAALNALGGVLVDQGASRAVLSFEAPPTDLQTSVEAFLNKAPWTYFTIAWGVGETAAKAENAARHYQLTSMWSIAMPDPKSADTADQIEGHRPATEVLKVNDNPDLLLSESVFFLLSKSVFFRRENGRKRRPQLFQNKQALPPSSFEDIADGSDTDHAGLSSKLALVVADGMGGGALRDTFKSNSDFSKAMQAFRSRLSMAIETWAFNEGLYIDTPEGTRIKIDVLVWGGDDMVFVLPAQNLLSFLTMMETVLSQPFSEGRAPFAHRLGCVVAKRKTPIRKLKTLAETAEVLIKSALTPEEQKTGKSYFTIDIFESSPLPFDSVMSFRKAIYGQSYQNGEDLFLLSDAAMLSEFLGTLGVKDDPNNLSLNQIYRATDAARHEGKDLADPRTTQVIEGKLNHYFERLSGMPAPITDWKAAVSVRPRSTGVFLGQIAQLHPYSPKAFGNPR